MTSLDRMHVRLPGDPPAHLAEVGGKALALEEMAGAGLPVLAGSVLTTAFFAPWLARLRETPAWAALEEATPETEAAACEALQARCAALPFTPAQRAALAALERPALAAVRSSSPEEDLRGSSFAGIYISELGVPPEGLEDALRRCFASCLDARVAAYKRAHGLDPRRPRLAVLVQRQLDSEVAGVGFSIHPHTNDYDEALLSACWGQGQAVVDGTSVPDVFVLDKLGLTVKERILGSKRRSIWLADGGGTVAREGHRSAEPCLTDAQLRELGALLRVVEERCGRPTEIEWAFAEGRLWLLQARPISRYVPLPAAMQTAPGGPRRLYADAALAKGMTLNAPISPLGLDLMQLLFASVMDKLVGPLAEADRLTFFAGSRMYADLSNMLWLQEPDKLAKSSTATDALMARTLAAIDAGRYRAPRRPSWARWKGLPWGLGILRRSARFLANLVRGWLAPERFARRFRRYVAANRRALSAPLDPALSIARTARRLRDQLEGMFDILMPGLLIGIGAHALARRLWGEGGARLGHGLRGNVVVEMGIALFEVSQTLPLRAYDDLDALARRLEARALPGAFLDRWDAFVARYGARGPREMDPVSPRYADDPRLVLDQLAALRRAGVDPREALAARAEERRRSHAGLHACFGPLRRWLLRSLQHRIRLFVPTRDTPKQHLVLAVFALRRRALLEGRRLVAAGRLDAPEDIFGLRLADLERARSDPALDLRALRHERTRFAELLRTHVRRFPLVIDSRGRILRPPAEEQRPGELRGMAVSSGVARGPVHILREARGAALAPGAVLVAYTTDPGWTPLFIGAAAVLLEVGGVLQHGAVVARELGKPCVVGIEGLLERLEDGQRVEVDGDSGVVRLL